MAKKIVKLPNCGGESNHPMRTTRRKSADCAPERTNGGLARTTFSGYISISAENRKAQMCEDLLSLETEAPEGEKGMPTYVRTIAHEVKPFG